MSDGDSASMCSSLYNQLLLYLQVEAKHEEKTSDGHSYYTHSC